MKLTRQNYFSKEADMEFMSVSQYKQFMGTYGRPGCEAKALAVLEGKWTDERSKDMLIGSYVDAYFSGKLVEFSKANPEFGKSKENMDIVKRVIDALEKHEYIMRLFNGQRQRIFIGRIGGFKWKCMTDFYQPLSYIADLKVMRSLTEQLYVKDAGYMSFVLYWGYDLQLAVQQELESQLSGRRLPVVLAAVSKEKYPNAAVVALEQKELDYALDIVINNVNRIAKLKQGLAEPTRCEACNYCVSTKRITGVVHHSELISIGSKGA